LANIFSLCDVQERKEKKEREKNRPQCRLEMRAALSLSFSLSISLSLFLSWASSDTKREVKSAGTTRLIEMRITRKKNGTESGGMIGRHAMCPFDRSLHSLFASPSSPARKELRKGKREKERERERERARGVGLRANIAYIPKRHARSEHVAPFWTPVAYPEAGLKWAQRHGKY
jgi:hypothetical protein